MAKIPINSYQGSSAYIATIPIEDGNILYNSTTKEILVDENGTRIRYGGAIVVDTALSTTSTNPVQNKVITTNINTINANLSNITSDVSDLQTGLQSAEDSITNAFEVSAPIEKSPSTHNYAVGDYLIWNEALRIVTSPISTGQALTNSNTRLTNTGKELSQINSDLSDISNALTPIEYCLRNIKQIDLRIQSPTQVWLDIDTTPNDGITLGFNSNGISAWRRDNGVQTQIFSNH